MEDDKKIWGKRKHNVEMIFFFLGQNVLKQSSSKEKKMSVFSYLGNRIPASNLWITRGVNEWIEFFRS